MEVSYADGRGEAGGLDGLAVVTEDGNPHNRCGMEQRRAVAAGIGDRLGRDAAAVTPTAGDG